MVSFKPGSTSGILLKILNLSVKYESMQHNKCG
jgi:hypothetical protein